MDKDFSDFLSEIDRGKYDEKREKLTETYLGYLKEAKTDQSKAAVAMEYAQRFSLFTLECYHDWLQGTK